MLYLHLDAGEVQVVVGVVSFFGTVPAGGKSELRPGSMLANGEARRRDGKCNRE
jgi:hypothetical protein